MCAIQYIAEGEPTGILAVMMKNTCIAGVALLALAQAGFAQSELAQNDVASGPGPAPVVLRLAADFVILSKAGITDVPASKITGNAGTSPITGAADLLTCTEETGMILSVNAAGQDPCSIKDASKLTLAVLYMEAAYKDAAGRPNPDFTELKRGLIGGLVLAPGLYKWSSNVKILSDITISGGPNDVWIFQVAGNLVEGNGMAVHLSGGALAKNIYWQVAGLVTLGTTSHLEGIVLAKSLIAMKTGATINGRLLSQTAVTLEKNKITRPKAE